MLWPFNFKLKITTRYKQCLNEECHCGLFINQENSHFAYIDFCDIDDKEISVYEDKFELRYFNSESQINARVNCMNFIRLDANLDETQIEWSNIPSNTNDDMFKCARILNDDTELLSSSFLVRINDLVSVRYDIDFDGGERVLSKIAVKLNEDEDGNRNGNDQNNFGGLCGNFAKNSSFCENFVDDANKCENNASALYDYWK